MRYSIMLQLVGFMMLIWLGSAAFFAWIQNRTAPAQSNSVYILQLAKLDSDR